MCLKVNCKLRVNCTTTISGLAWQEFITTVISTFLIFLDRPKSALLSENLVKCQLYYWNYIPSYVNGKSRATSWSAPGIFWFTVHCNAAAVVRRPSIESPLLESVLSVTWLYILRGNTTCVRLILVLTPRWRSKSVGSSEKLSRTSFQLEDWSPSIWSITMTKSCQCGVSWSHLAYRYQYFWEIK